MTGNSSKHVVVIGAGIIGASIAWHLTRAGARATIIEAREPGGVATPNSFSWINSNFSFSETYFRLRHHSMMLWKKLADDLPQLPVSLSGSIYLPAEGLDLEEFVSRSSAWGYRIELIDGSRVQELEPGFRTETELAALSHDEGAAEAEEVAQGLAEAAVAGGASLSTGRVVDEILLDDGKVTGVRIGDERIEAEEVVIAAGVASPELLRGTGYDLPFKSPAGLLVHTKPVGKILDRLILADGLHVRQKPNGQILAGADFQGEFLADEPEAGSEILMARCREALAGGEALELDRYSIGYRPMPQDGSPVLGRPNGIPGLYLAVMHSGVTLCPAVGAMATRELLEGDRDTLLEPFGPDRFAREQPAAARA